MARVTRVGRTPTAKKSRGGGKNWIPELKKGQLHKDLGIPQKQKIPLTTLQSAAKKKGKVGSRARFAIKAKSFKH